MLELISKDNHETLKLLYFQVTDLWKRLCESHNQLLDFTFDEYQLLLDGRIDELEIKIDEKKELIDEISGLDSIRTDLIRHFNKILPSELAIENVSELLEVVSRIEDDLEQKHLQRFNAVLIDIIEKIQAQNKKNQLFINKAIYSIQTVKEGVTGEKNYKTYNQRGASRSSL